MNAYVERTRTEVGRNKVVDKRRQQSPRDIQPPDIQKEYQARLRDNPGTLRANKASPQQLHFLAAIYFGHSSHAAGETPRERLLRFLEDDALVALTIEAFAGVPSRPDLPSVEKAFALAAESQMPLLAWPLLAGLEERFDQSDTPLKDARFRQALAIRALYDPMLPHRADPKWHRWAVKNRPGLVAETIVAVFKAALRGATMQQYGLYELAHDPAYAEVARACILPLLRTFPTRARADQLERLTLVLTAAFSHCDGDTLRTVINSKLSARSMGAKQRLHWLCAALLHRPAEYLPQLKRELADGATQRRVRWIAEFLGRNVHLAQLDDIRVAALLARALGSDYRPVPVTCPSIGVSPGETVIPKLIRILATTPDAEATILLDELIRDPALASWHETLRRAASEQREVRRDAEFRYPQA